MCPCMVKRQESLIFFSCCGQWQHPACAGMLRFEVGKISHCLRCICQVLERSPANVRGSVNSANRLNPSRQPTIRIIIDILWKLPYLIAMFELDPIELSLRVEAMLPPGKDYDEAVRDLPRTLSGYLNDIASETIGINGDMTLGSKYRRQFPNRRDADSSCSLPANKGDRESISGRDRGASCMSSDASIDTSDSTEGPQDLVLHSRVRRSNTGVSKRPVSRGHSKARRSTVRVSKDPVSRTQLNTDRSNTRVDKLPDSWELVQAVGDIKEQTGDDWRSKVEETFPDVRADEAERLCRVYQNFQKSQKREDGKRSQYWLEEDLLILMRGKCGKSRKHWASVASELAKKGWKKRNPSSLQTHFYRISELPSYTGKKYSENLNGPFSQR